MTGTDRIRDLLRRAARDGRIADGATRTGTGGARLVEQIDAAVLGRRLRVEAGAVSFGCDVAARRLLALDLPVAAPLPPGAEALAGRPLGAEDVAAVAALVRTLCPEDQPVSIVAGAPGAGPPAFGGIPAAALAAALGLAPPAAHDDPFAAGLVALGDAVRAAVLVDGEEIVLLSGGAAAERLADRAAGLLDRLLVPQFPLLGTLETGGALLLAAPPGQSHLLLAGHLGRFLLVEVAGDDGSTGNGAARCLALWRDAALS